MASGISVPDQSDRHRGYILRPLQHPPAWGGLCPGSLARDEEQVADTARADLCQEEGARSRGGWLLQLGQSFQYSIICGCVLNYLVIITKRSVPKTLAVGKGKDYSKFMIRFITIYVYSKFLRQ